MKRFISMILICCFLFLLPVNAYAAEAAQNKSNNYWGYNGETVLIDEYHTDSYSIYAYYDGSILYAVTILHDGRIEFAWAPIGGSVRSLWLTGHDLTAERGISYTRNDPHVLSAAVKEYGLSNADKSTSVAVTHTSVPISSLGITSRATGSDDHRSLQNQMATIHGPKYSMVKWTSFDMIYSGGLKYTFKESLDYEVYFYDRFTFSDGITLGALFLAAAAFFTGAGTPAALTLTLKILGAIFAVAPYAEEYIPRSGAICNYRGEAVYYRYTFIDDAGPYFQCWKKINYDGWAEEGNSNTAQLIETITEYGPAVGGSQQMFESYQLQKDRAYYIYQLENNNG